MPWESDESRAFLCLWLLDQVRCRLPRNLRYLAERIYEIEADIHTAYPQQKGPSRARTR